MTKRIKAVITEELYATGVYGREALVASDEISIDLSKWVDFVDSNSFAAGYVEHIIHAIKQGWASITTSHKYMFMDMPASYTPLVTTEPDENFDEVVHIWVSNI